MLPISPTTQMLKYCVGSVASIPPDEAFFIASLVFQDLTEVDFLTVFTNLNLTLVSPAATEANSAGILLISVLVAPKSLLRTSICSAILASDRFSAVVLYNKFTTTGIYNNTT